MTAVQWLIEQIEDTISNTIVAKAKEMEKQQIINAHVSGYDSSGESAEDYYKFFYDKTN